MTCFYQRVSDTHRRRAFYRLLKHVRVWYDYASLPQARETSEEQAVFDRALDRLASIVNQSEVLALWGIESINRAWCVFEVLAGKKVHFCAPAQANFDFMQKAMFKASGYPDLGGVSWAAEPEHFDPCEVIPFRRCWPERAGN